MRITLVMIMVAACTTSEPSSQTTPIELCGRPPLAPGFSVGYPGDGTAVLPAAQMQAIGRFLSTDYEAWAACVESIR